MSHVISLNEKKVKVIAYFMFESTRNYYLIYCEPKSKNEIYIGQVIQENEKNNVVGIDRTSSFIIKKLIKDLTEKNLDTIRCYRYLNKITELKDNFIFRSSQKVYLEKEQKKNLEEFIEEINKNNEDILAKATQEYYIQLVEQRAKDRKTVCILLGVIIFIVFVIVKMILDFM